MTIEIGQAAPDFTLYSEKKQVTLSALKGHNVLFYFFLWLSPKHVQQNLCM